MFKFLWKITTKEKSLTMYYDGLVKYFDLS